MTHIIVKPSFGKKFTPWWVASPTNQTSSKTIVPSTSHLILLLLCNCYHSLPSVSLLCSSSLFLFAFDFVDFLSLLINLLMIGKWDMIRMLIMFQPWLRYSDASSDSHYRIFYIYSKVISSVVKGWNENFEVLKM